MGQVEGREESAPTTKFMATIWAFGRWVLNEGVAAC